MMASAGPPPDPAPRPRPDPAPNRAAPAPPAPRWWVDALWLGVLGVWTAAYCVSSSPRVGVTYDEPFYMDAGMDAWRGWDPRADGKPRGWDHDWVTRNGVMPLPPEAATVPLYAHERRSGEKLARPDDKMARLPDARRVTLLWLWLLVVSAWRLGRTAGGPWAGRLAAGLIACDPNFLAHSTLATTDVATAATLTAFAHAVYAGRAGGWWRRVVAPGLWYGVAVLCKLSSLLYGGLILVVLEVCYRFASGGLSRPPGGGLGAWARKIATATGRSVLAAAGVVVIGVAVALAYCGRPQEGHTPFVDFAAGIPEGERLAPKYRKLAEDFDRPPHALAAFAFQWWHNDKGRPAYLNGTYYPEGVWYYYPVVLAMKVPLPVILLAAACVVRPRGLANPFALAALVLLAALLQGNLQIGFRLGFPVLAVGYVAVAVAVGRGFGRYAWRLGAPAVLALAATSVWMWPHGLCYLNQFAGGPDAAPYRVSDSNCDWGQGAPDLLRWYEENGATDIWVWYFGTDAAVRRPPFSQFEPPEWVASGPDLCKAVGPRVLAVGHTVITLHPEKSPQKAAALKYLRTRRPLARTPTFVLYDFRTGEPPPLD